MPLIHTKIPVPDLKVRWRSGLTPNFELQDSNIRGYVGVRANHQLAALETHDEVETLPMRKEYLMAIVDGHLWACDEKTAKAAASWAKTTNFRQYMFPAEEAPKAAPDPEPQEASEPHEHGDH